jgi:hypothetical protein
VVSSLCPTTHITQHLFQGAFLDSVIHPDAVDDRKGAVSFSLPLMDNQLDACLVFSRFDTLVAASFLLRYCDVLVKLRSRHAIQHYSSRTSRGLCFCTLTRRLSLAFSLLRHCSDISTISVKLMVEATTFRSPSWDALVSHMRGVSSPSGAQHLLLFQIQV